MSEIERKFVVSQLPEDVRGARAVRLRQGYLSVEPAEVRIRSRDDREHELTVKSIGALERVEVTLPLTPDQFEDLWPLARRSIDKIRTLHDVEGGTAEVDVYAGKLAGLVVVEVEFGSDADASRFTPPSWFGTEVTEDPRYRNAALAGAESPPT